MIDYKKLNLLNKLCEKYYENTGESIFIELRLNYGCSSEPHAIWISNELVTHGSLTEMITKLQELTQPEPIYTVGSTWWFLNGPSFDRYPTPKSLLITEQNQKWYRRDDEWFSSREALIQDQINYWKKLNQEHCEHNYCMTRFECIGNTSKAIQCCSKCGQDKPECEHQDDGQIYYTNPPQVKCIKCGEYYK